METTSANLGGWNMPPEKLAEGLGIVWAVTSGECDQCRERKQCEASENFKFPATAACMVHKAEILNTGNGGGKG